MTSHDGNQSAWGDFPQLKLAESPEKPLFTVCGLSDRVKGTHDARFKMPSLGMNLWVTANSDQGGRKYMEDVFDVLFDREKPDEEARYAYFGVFDGHGGPEAANFAKKHLRKEIVKNEGFWCEDDDEKVLNAISEGFKSTHKMMWNSVGSWPQTASGYPSTSGCTASVIFIRNSKMYVGHVGDSGIVLGTQNSEKEIVAEYITEDHKPESKEELTRIQACGGQVMTKAGIHRVVWDRPRKPFSGPLRRSTPIEHIPFLAVSRALGDLWSYNSETDEFVVSPEPDVQCIHLDPFKHKTLILASDGLWHIMQPQDSLDAVKEFKEMEETDPVSPATAVLYKALKAWQAKKWRADNITVIVIEIEPPELVMQWEDGEEFSIPVRFDSRASSASTVVINNEEDGESEGDMDEPQNAKSKSRASDEHEDLPRSTSNTPVSGPVVPFSPLQKCVAKKTHIKNKLKSETVKGSSFEGDDQDSRETGSFQVRRSDLPKKTSKLAEPNSPRGGADKKSVKSKESPVNSPGRSPTTNTNANNSASLSDSPINSHLKQENLKPTLPVNQENTNTSGHSHSPHKISHSRKSREGASPSEDGCGESDKHSGASQAVLPSQVGASSGLSKDNSRRSSRQVGLNLTNSTASSSSLNRWPLETPAGWTSIKGADQEQQVTACSAIGSEIAAGTWPESLDLGPSSIADPAPSEAPSACYGACEYAPENPPCKKCIPAGAPAKKASKRKASPPLASMSKRFRSCVAGHRTRSAISRIKNFHSRASRRAVST